MRKRWLALLLSCAVAVNTCVVPAAATTVSDAAIATQQTVSAEDAETQQIDSDENTKAQGGQNADLYTSDVASTEADTTAVSETHNFLSGVLVSGISGEKAFLCSPFQRFTVKDRRNIKSVSLLCLRINLHFLLCIYLQQDFLCIRIRKTSRQGFFDRKAHLLRVTISIKIFVFCLKLLPDLLRKTAFPSSS